MSSSSSRGRVLLLICIILHCTTVILGQIPSPCPDIFQYEGRKNDEDQWFGSVRIRSDEELSGVWIQIKLDRPAHTLGNWFGSVTTSDNTEYSIKNLKYNLHPGRTEAVRFFIRFDLNKPIPIVENIRLNGRKICSSRISEESVATTTQVYPTSYTKAPLFTSRTYVSSPTTHGRIENFNENESNRPATLHSSWYRTTEKVHNYEREQEINTNTYTTKRTRINNYEENENNNKYRTTTKINSYEREPEISSNNNNYNYNSNNNNNNNEDSSYKRYKSSTEKQSSYEREEKPSYSIKRTKINNTEDNNNSRYRSSTERLTYQQRDYETSKKPSYTVKRTKINSYESTEDNSRYRSTSKRTENYPDVEFPDRVTTYTPAQRSRINIREEEQNIPVTTQHRRFKPATKKPEIFEGDFSVTILNQQNPILELNSPQCGALSDRIVPLVTGGYNTSEGQFPWHVALYTSDSNIYLKYICGGNLISNSHIITAAHCVTKPRTNTLVDLTRLQIYLGTSNLVKFDPSLQVRSIKSAFVHPNYNHTHFYNDIAVVKLSSPVEFTDYVRPICLWDEEVPLSNIIDKVGTVVGWGHDDNNLVTDMLRGANMPVVETQKCIYSNRDFFSKVMFERNYCAGFRNGTSVCNGDSGGGMIFRKKGTGRSNAIWHLRGIVSISVALQGGYCNPDHYIVFTDVAQYLDWIRKVIN